MTLVTGKRKSSADGGKSFDIRDRVENEEEEGGLTEAPISNVMEWIRG